MSPIKTVTNLAKEMKYPHQFILTDIGMSL